MKPQVIHLVSELRSAVASARAAGRSIGFVPTMGALHAGHRSLIETARRQTGFVVVSIFVNPTQFGPKEDLARYPRPLERDLELCAAAGADLVFVPSVAEVYPPGFCTWVEVQGPLAETMEGASRPGHFRGVTTVVLKLLNMVQADVAFFGQKDAQQARLVQQLVRDLNVPTTIQVSSTVREPDGLALSSRNVYLTPEQRGHATVLFRALNLAAQLVRAGERDAAKVRQAMVQLIEQTPGAVLDYVELVSHATLQPSQPLEGDILIALAVRFGTTRLIDNQIIRV
jgi:pantoate--beta-alanine ligase